MSNIILYSQEARNKLKAGVDALADAVKVTLGPKGRNVIFDRKFGAPTITKDGVTVAKEIRLEDPIENMGAQVIRDVASKTSDVAGDGTTTATVLAQAIFREGIRNVTAGANPMDLKRGIDLAVTNVITELKNLSKPVNGKADIASIGSISSNGDTGIGDLIAEAMEKVGNDGVITVEDAKGIETELTLVDGLQFDRGYLSPYFVTDAERMEVDLPSPYIIIYDKKISAIDPLLPLLEQIVRAQRPILIIAEDVDGSALATLVINKLKAQLPVVAVKAPGFGDRRNQMLEDIAVMTGGKVISEGMGYTLERADLSLLGTCNHVVVTRDTTTIVGGAGKKEDIARRTNEVKGQIENTISDYDKEKLQERLAKLSGGVAVLKIGASTEVEMKEKKARVEDALHATRAAVEEGIVPGGGVAYLRCMSGLQALADSQTNADIKTGIQIIRRSLEEPIRTIVGNAGLEGSVIVDKVKGEAGAPVASSFGFNAATEQYEDLFASGVIDPTKVTRCALQNAASVASLLLTTECVIVEKKEPVPQMMPQGGGMGEMY